MKSWSWKPDGETARSVCGIPAKDTNPAKCTFPPGKHGVLTLVALVNGVPETHRKNISVVTNPRVCTSKALDDWWPITTNFGTVSQTHPDGHTGRDYGAPKGVRVYAVESGTVVFRGSAGSAGNMVVIHSPTVDTYYMHFDGFAPGLQEGEQVTAGTLIGYVGNTGHSVSLNGGDGSHLHIEQHAPPGPPYFVPVRKGNPPKTRNLPPPNTKIEPCFF